jgi:hypothetical protein
MVGQYVAIQTGWKLIDSLCSSNGELPLLIEDEYKQDKQYLLSKNVLQMPLLFKHTTGTQEVFIDHPTLLRKYKDKIKYLDHYYQFGMSLSRALSGITK